MLKRFIEIVEANAVELGIIAVVGFVLLLILAYAVLKASDASARAIQMEEEDRLR